MNILSIGNDLTTNIHKFLSEMAKADGNDDLLLCNLMIDNCSLEHHWQNWREEKTAYNYEIYLPGETEMNLADDIALHEAVEDEDWDVIALCQCGALSGIRESYSPYLSEIAEYCRMVQPKAKILLIQPWAYENGCTDPFFANYSKNRSEMYRALTQACVDAALEADINFIVPCGRAWQSTENLPIGALTTDGKHGNDVGCYLAGACLYESVFDKSIYTNSFFPKGLPESLTEVLKLCAHTSVEKGIIRKQ